MKLRKSNVSSTQKAGGGAATDLPWADKNCRSGRGKAKKVRRYRQRIPDIVARRNVSVSDAQEKGKGKSTHPYTWGGLKGRRTHVLMSKRKPGPFRGERDPVNVDGEKKALTKEEGRPGRSGFRCTKDQRDCKGLSSPGAGHKTGRRNLPAGIKGGHPGKNAGTIGHRGGDCSTPKDRRRFKL